MKNPLASFLEWLDRGAHAHVGVRYYSKEDIRDLNLRIENFIQKCRLEAPERSTENTFWRLIRMIDLLRSHPDYIHFCQRIGIVTYVPNTDYGFEVPKEYTALSHLAREIAQYAKRLLVRDDLSIHITHHALLKNYRCFVKVLKQDIYSPHTYGLCIGTIHHTAILEFNRILD